MEYRQGESIRMLNIDGTSQVMYISSDFLNIYRKDQVTSDYMSNLPLIDNSEEVLRSDLRILGDRIMDKFEKSNDFLLLSIEDFDGLDRGVDLQFNDIELITVDNTLITIKDKKQPCIASEKISIIEAASIVDNAIDVMFNVDFYLYQLREIYDDKAENYYLWRWI